MPHSTFRARRALLFLPALALLVLAGCDANGSSDPISGFWKGDVRFTADSVLATQNARITADYDMTFEFDLDHDDGLVAGEISARRSGVLIYREAGLPADTFRFDDTLPVAVNQAFGTYIEPVLELDVPEGPYEDGMWTFDMTSRRGQTETYIYHLWTFTRSDGQTFEYGIQSDEPFQMRTADAPETATETLVSEPTYDGVLVDLRSTAAKRLQRSEQ